jgi:hypothetical protein
VRTASLAGSLEKRGEAGSCSWHSSTRRLSDTEAPTVRPEGPTDTAASSGTRDTSTKVWKGWRGGGGRRGGVGQELGTRGGGGGGG